MKTTPSYNRYRTPQRRSYSIDMPNYDTLQFVFPCGPAPLPAHAPEDFTAQQNEAYVGAQAIESLSQWSVMSSGSMTPQVAGRLLGYMLLEAPTVEGRDNVTFDIVSCAGDEARLKQLAQLYAKVYIRTFQANGGRTPSNYMDELSPEESGDEEEDVPLASVMEETHWERTQNASKRDRHRCILARCYDLQYMYDLSQLEPEHPLFRVSDPFGSVDEARIIPIERKANIAVSEPQAKLENPMSAPAILLGFGKTDIFKKLNVDDLNHLSNMMTLNSSLHGSFDGFKCVSRP